MSRASIEEARGRARRSVHFVPGGNAKMRARAASLDADACVFDLEDAVAADDAAKADARSAVAAWLGENPTRGRPERVVRINASDTRWFEADLETIVPARPDALMLPKVRSRAELRAIDARLQGIEARLPNARLGALPVIVIATETPSAVFGVHEIARGPRVAAITWGAEDLSAELGARSARGSDGRYLPVFSQARTRALLAARAAGVQAIDGVFTALKDEAGLEAECDEAAAMGFDGKLTIHPAQLAPVNAAFSPGAAELEDARALLAAYEEHAKSGSGALRFRGEMIDAPHVARAQRLLARAAAQPGDPS